MSARQIWEASAVLSDVIAHDHEDSQPILFLHFPYDCTQCGLISHPEDEGSMFLRNVHNTLLLHPATYQNTVGLYHCRESRKVAGSISDDLTGFFN
jgi:hypothetical protein